MTLIQYHGGLCARSIICERDTQERSEASCTLAPDYSATLVRLPDRTLIVLPVTLAPAILRFLRPNKRYANGADKIILINGTLDFFGWRVSSPNKRRARIFSEANFLLNKRLGIWTGHHQIIGTVAAP